MSGLGFWLLGLAMGLRHALDPDHLVAVSVMVAESGSFRPAARIGAIWGIGHTLTILLFGVPLLLLRMELPERVQASFEGLVGLVLIALGGTTLWRLWRRRVHLHWHEHDGERHLHFHEHDATPHEHPHAHHHEHPHWSTGWRPLLIGMVHGLAGSGAAAVMVMSTADSLLAGLIYLAIFGIGSILGMTATAFVLSLPVWIAQQRFERAYSALLTLTGIVSVAFGISLLWELGHALRA
jgi:ABC-type nickel/cobalt efflux system permease component RcnA